MLKPHQIDHHAAEPVDPEHLERERVAGAIKTDFILSAEIMVIALSTIDSGSIWRTAVVLAVVAIAITALVYGTVALLVKADDIGLKMSLTSRVAAFRALGRGIVKAMPGVLTTIGLVGTAAMLWVGGSIVIHGLEEMGAGGLGHMIHDIEAAATRLAPVANGFVGWLVKAILDGIFGLALGLAVIPVATHVLAPLSARMTAQKPS
jgi:predicted DNA repair protein MutK